MSRVDLMKRATRLTALTLAAAFAFGCASVPPAASESRLRAEITRTEFGIPHVVARDFESLGYGIGYAYAQDNFCLFAEKINQLNGERSRYFGGDAPVHIGIGESISSRESDLFYRSQFPRAEVNEAYRDASRETVELTRGYAAGVNRYLRETGVDALPEPCRGAAWVRPIEEADLYLWYTAVATLLATQQVPGAILAAQPPAPAEASHPLPPEALTAAFEVDSPSRTIGSNAWAFGREATTNGRGLLLGNPHWPWGNINQFYQAHLTIPGTLDVMGVTYGGMPLVLLGFNRTIAWSHTVSTGSRSVIRELTLSPGSPTSYLVDGETREMESRLVSIEVLGDDGVLRQESRTFYRTELGPVIVRDGMPWTATTAYALTDMNLENRRLVDQWLRIGRAASVAQVRQALGDVLAIPWVNTLAADAAGNALYADYSVKPYVTDELLKACGGSETARRATQSGLLTLDGSKRGCDPATDSETPQPGILPPRLLPLLERADYVANSNNTYWLTNARAPITGLPSVNGSAGTFLGFRPQSGLRIIEARLAGQDTLPGNRFDSRAVQALVFGSPDYPGLGNHNRAAEVTLGAVREICGDGPTVTLPEGQEVDITAACRVLANWDQRHDFASVGAHVFRLFWSTASRIPRLWGVPFDPAIPLETPREPNVSDSDVRAALRQSLGGAVARLSALGIGLDRPWGEVHTQPVGDRRVPVDGNASDVLNVMIAGGLTAEGFTPIVHGASYVQIVGFDERGPQADAVLLFGQSSNPASPYYFDQLEKLWLKREWNRLPFEVSEIEARAISRISIEE